MNIWNKSKDSQLITLVCGQRVLYDPSAPEHRNVVAKHRAWTHISQTLNIPIPAIKKRWKHFRDHYRKKERQTQTKIKNNWEYMPLLGFLSQVNTDNQESEAQTSNVEDVTDTEDINNSKESNSIQRTVEKHLSNSSDSKNKGMHEMKSEVVSEKRREMELEYRLSRIKESFAKIDSDRKGIENFFLGKKKRSKSVEIYGNRKSVTAKEIYANTNKKKTDKDEVIVGLGDPGNNFLNYNYSTSENNENNQVVRVPNLQGASLDSNSLPRNYKDMLIKIPTKYNSKRVGKREITEVHENRKRRKTTKESNSEEMTDTGVRREEILETLSRMRSKFQSMVLDLERCVEKTGSYAKAWNRVHVSPVHRYFEVVADIVAMFPPHLVAKTRLKTCETINQIE